MCVVRSRSKGPVGCVTSIGGPLWSPSRPAAWLPPPAWGLARLATAAWETKAELSAARTSRFHTGFRVLHMHRKAQKPTIESNSPPRLPPEKHRGIGRTHEHSMHSVLRSDEMGCSETPILTLTSARTRHPDSAVEQSITVQRVLTRERVSAGGFCPSAAEWVEWRPTCPNGPASPAASLHDAGLPRSGTWFEHRQARRESLDSSNCEHSCLCRERYQASTELPPPSCRRPTPLVQQPQTISRWLGVLDRQTKVSGQLRGRSTRTCKM